jgi:hypothetical protein
LRNCFTAGHTSSGARPADGLAQPRQQQQQQQSLLVFVN